MRFIVARSFIILLISCSLLFFSLFFGLNKLSNSPLLIFFFFLRCTQTQTQTHPHTNTSIQTNQHRDTLAKKKTQRYTNTHTQTDPNGQTTKRQIGAYRNDQSSWVLLDRSSWDSPDQSSWVWVLPDRS